MPLISFIFAMKNPKVAFSVLFKKSSKLLLLIDNVPALTHLGAQCFLSSISSSIFFSEEYSNEIDRLLPSCNNLMELPWNPSGIFIAVSIGLLLVHVFTQYFNLSCILCRILSSFKFS